MSFRGERDLALLGSVIALGALAFRLGAMLGQDELRALPFIALLVAVAITGGATMALAAGYPRSSYRFMLAGGGLLLAAAVLNGLPLGVPVAVASALVWGATLRINAKLRRGYDGQK